MDRWVERLPVGAWAIGGSGLAAALLGATFALPPVGDLTALAGAAIAGLGGVFAAVRRRKLGSMPLELAPVAAVEERGTQAITFRAWLGRGRRVDALDVGVTWRGDDGERTLAAIVPSAPIVGRFQVVVRGLPDGWDRGQFTLTVEAREAGETWRTTRTYGPGDRRVGAFASGITRAGGRIAWVHSDWPHVDAPTD